MVSRAYQPLVVLCQVRMVDRSIHSFSLLPSDITHSLTLTYSLTHLFTHVFILSLFVSPPIILWCCCCDSDGCNVNRPTLQNMLLQFSGGDDISGGGDISRSRPSPSAKKHNNHNHSDINHHNHNHTSNHTTGHTHHHLPWGEVEYWQFDFHNMPFVLGVATKRRTDTRITPIQQ